jgi:DNA-directed RNA polymerase subunit RPC12/RpoP
VLTQIVAFAERAHNFHVTKALVSRLWIAHRLHHRSARIAKQSARAVNINTVFNIDDVFIDLECPRCGYVQDVQLIEVRLQRLIFCPGCKSRIQLVDADASAHVGAGEIEGAMTELSAALTRLGNRR